MTPQREKEGKERGERLFFPREKELRGRGHTTDQIPTSPTEPMHVRRAYQHDAQPALGPRPLIQHHQPAARPRPRCCPSSCRGPARAVAILAAEGVVLVGRCWIDSCDDSNIQCQSTTHATPFVSFFNHDLPARRKKRTGPSAKMDCAKHGVTPAALVDTFDRSIDRSAGRFIIWTGSFTKQSIDRITGMPTLTLPLVGREALRVAPRHRSCRLRRRLRPPPPMKVDDGDWDGARAFQVPFPSKKVGGGVGSVSA